MNSAEAEAKWWARRCKQDYDMDVKVVEVKLIW